MKMMMSMMVVAEATPTPAMMMMNWTMKQLASTVVVLPFEPSLLVIVIV